MRSCVRSPEERWLGHGQGDALFLPEERREREERDFASALLPLLLLLLSFFLFLPLDHAESLHSDDPRIRSSVSFAARAIRFG